MPRDPQTNRRGRSPCPWGHSPSTGYPFHRRRRAGRDRAEDALCQTGQLLTVELCQESEGTILHHMVIALALISRPNEVRGHIRLPTEAGGAQLIFFFLSNFQHNAVFAQRLQFFFHVHNIFSLLFRHTFPSSASTVFMAAESKLHCRSSRSIRANTSGKHSISS